MTELEEKAREYSIVYDTKYAEDGVLEEMLSRPQDFVDGAIIGVIQLLRKKAYRDGFIAGAKENGIIWHDLRKNPDDLPKVDRLVRVRLMSGMEHICETCYYEPSEDEIGYGKLIISFYELNGEWIDDTEIIAWCEVPKFEVEE